MRTYAKRGRVGNALDCDVSDMYSQYVTHIWADQLQREVNARRVILGTVVALLVGGTPTPHGRGKPPPPAFVIG